jgi:hypothetical protein
MSSDDLLRSLARVAREEATKDEGEARWGDLALGELDAEDVAALEKLAAEDAEAAEKLVAYRPLDDAAKDRIAARLAPAATAPAAAKVVPLAARPRRVAWIAAAVAIAAGVALWRGASTPESGPPLPAYAMVVSSGDRATRGTEPTTTEETVVAPDSRLEIRLRPAKQVAGSVAVRGFLVQGGVARPWVPPMQTSADGAVAIDGAASALLGVSAGTWDVVLAVGRPSDLPSADAILKAVAAGSAAGEPWQMFVRRVRIAPAP